MNKPGSDISRTDQAIRLCRQGEFEQAVRLLEELEQAHGLDEGACFLMGTVMGQLGQYDRALGYYRQVIERAPHKPQAYLGQAKALLMLGRPEEAEACFEPLIARFGGSPGVTQQLATMLLKHGCYEAAEKRFHQVLERDAASEAALRGLGKACQALRKPELARTYYENAIKVNPDSSENHQLLGTLLQTMGQVDEAEASFNKALALDDGNVGAHRDLGHLHMTMNRPEKAREHFRRAQALQPGNPEVIASLSRLEDQAGNLQAAFDLVAPIVERNLLHPEIGVAFAAICRHFDRCHQAVDYLEAVLAGASDQLQLKDKLHFALGKLYDGLGEYDQAFSHFAAGNKQKPDAYNHVEETACINELIRTCDWNYFVSAPRSSRMTERPVFIVGMPRSGTTLTEQILASHSDVSGLGELGVFPGIIKNLQSYLGVGATYPGSLANLTSGILDSIAADYLAGIAELCPADTPRFTDKSLVNYLYLGLLAQLFPGARFIHCRRDPRDTCLSIYFQNFDASHYYATTLQNLGGYYSLYRRLMKHWKSVLDIPILEMRYEDLVQDQEAKSRELIEFTGLEWDDRVLDFHDSKRSVVTASYDQVRRKIYTSSTARWKKYEKHIGPLLDAFEFQLENDA